MQILLRTYCAFFLLFICADVRAQEALYIGSGATFYVDSSAVVTVIGNVNNQSGSGGNVFVHGKSVFRFYGGSWQNAASSPVAGKGTIQFIQPQPAPYTGNTSQTLIGGGNGSSFPSVSIDNSNNVNLSSSNSKLRDTLKFVSGHVILNRRDLTVGNNNPGTITGYTENRFVVTNHTNSSDSGYLRRENLGSSSGTVYFPVGYAVGDYTPASISNVGSTDDYNVRVFPNVYTEGNTGALRNNESVGRTWDLREDSIGGSKTTIGLQHNTSSEGSIFAGSSNKHYITRYAGYSGSNGGDTVSGSNWDLKFYSALGAGSTPGTITTGSSITGGVLTTRYKEDTLGYFTKTVYDVYPLPIELINLQARWKNRDAVVSWTTLMELNNRGFEVQRSLNGVDFETIGFVSTLAPGGNSVQPLNYTYTDPNLKNDQFASYYFRLKQLDLDGSITYTPWVKLEDQGSNVVSITAFPNPADAMVYLSTKGITRGQREIIIYDGAGRRVFERNENGDIPALDAINISNLVPGVYQLEITSKGESKLFKLLVE